MAKQRIIKIPKIVSITCPNCKKICKRKVPDDQSSPQVFDCDKCNTQTRTPITSCCIICAFTNKKCPYSLKQKAKRKGLEIRN